MKESTQIVQEQRTLQRLTPQQVQFVRLLEMNGPEIEDEVRRQLDDNPALEIVDNNESLTAEDSDTTMDMQHDNDPDDDPADYHRPASRESEPWTIQVADDTPTLNQYLIEQLGELELPDLTDKIARYVIGCIDDNGYLTRSYASIADDITINTGIDITRADVENAANIVRTLDPPGVGAVDLRDCLLLQVDRIAPTTLASRVAHEILAHNFDLFSNKHYDRLQAQLGVSKETLKEAERLIKSLNPKPGSALITSQSVLRSSQITPDVAVDYDEGRFSVYLLSSIPQLQIERSFLVNDEPETDKVSERCREARRQTQAFIKLKRDEAESFISALKMRSNTLLVVTEAIVKLQKDFFVTGDTSMLHPMILKDVANITGLDISVISRATSGKYVATSSGVYPFKFFFNEAPKVDSDTSSHQILHELKKIIDAEDKRHPLSDATICELMAKKGFDLARRTVNKYRERLGIPVARLRKII